MTDMSFTELQKLAGENSRAKGFRAEGEFLVNMVEKTHDSASATRHETNLRNYYANRLMLIVGEVAEAHEELRTGHGVGERYYSNPSPDRLGKPEGVPSEMADIVIRVLDFADEIEVDLYHAIAEKMSYNSTRAALHGKKF